jgi:hypothetical protein
LMITRLVFTAVISPHMTFAAAFLMIHFAIPPSPSKFADADGTDPEHTKLYWQSV